MDEDFPDSVNDNDNSDNDEDNDNVGIEEDNNDDDEADEYVNTRTMRAPCRLPAPLVFTVALLFSRLCVYRDPYPATLPCKVKTQTHKSAI